MKSKVDKLDVDKLVPVSIDLSKLSDVLKNDVVVKNDVYRVSSSGGGGGAIGGKKFDKSPLTRILSLPINVPLHLVWHPLPSIYQSHPIIWYIYINYII